MRKRSNSSRAKIYYRPVEAAIRWSGLLRREAQILKTLDLGYLPVAADFSRWPRLGLNVARIIDGLVNGELPYGKNGVTSTDPTLLQSPDLTIRHIDLKIWMRKYYPEERPAFLFNAFEQKLHPTIDLDTVRTLLTEREALKVQLTMCDSNLQRLQIQHKTLQTQYAAIAPQEGSLHPRSETTYLNIIGALLSLLLGLSPAGKPYSLFKTLESVISAMLAHHGGLPGISERTLWAKFTAARKRISSDSP